jgi:hypothetical protein
MSQGRTFVKLDRDLLCGEQTHPQLDGKSASLLDSPDGTGVFVGMPTEFMQIEIYRE